MLRFHRKDARRLALGLAVLAASSGLVACNIILGIGGGLPGGTTTGAGGATGLTSTSSSAGGGTSSSSSPTTSSTGGTGGTSSSSSAGTGGSPPIVCDGTGPADPDGPSPTALYGQRAGGAGEEQGLACTFKDDGSAVVLAGTFQDNGTTFGGASTNLGYPTPDGAPEGRDVYVTWVDQGTGNVLWAEPFGGPLDQWPSSILVDGGRNVVFAGSMQGSLTVGPNTVSSDVSMHADGTDGFVAKLDEFGAPQWVIRFGGPAYEEVTQMALYGGTDIIVAGVSSGHAGGTSVDFGVGCGSKSLSAAQQGVFLARYDGDGHCVWANLMPVSTGFTDLGSPFHPVAVTTGSDGNIYLTGGASGSSNDLGGGTLSDFGGVDAFVAQFDGDGNHQWSFSFGELNLAGHDQWGTGIAIDACADIIVTGGFNGEVDFDAQHEIIDPNGAADTHAFIVKLGPTSTLPAQVGWAKGFVDTGVQQINAVTIDANSEIAIAGDLTDTAASQGVNFGGGPLLGVHPDAGPINSDAFVAKFNGAGTLHWAKRLGGTGTETARGVAVDNAGHTAIIGDLDGVDDFGKGSWVSVGQDMYYLELH